MQVVDPAALRAATAARRSAGGRGPTAAFRLPDAAARAEPGVVRAAPTLGAPGLLHLQEFAEPVEERRRRASRRALQVLDRLEDLQRMLLAESGTLDVAALAGFVTEAPESTGTPELDALIAQLRTRSAVELAKLGIDVFAT